MKLLKSVFAFIFPTAVLRNSKTVQYAFSFMFIFAAILGMAAVVSTNESTIKIVSSAESVERGKQFSVDVMVRATTPVNAVDIEIAFPKDQIEIVGIDRGESVLTLWTADPKVDSGVVYLQGGTYQRGFIGEHKIATINVKALKNGQATFIPKTIRLLAGDGKGTLVPARTDDSAYNTAIYDPGTTPPPATLKGGGEVFVVTDVDNDGKVTLRDISSFMGSWANGGVVYDFNNDGAMTFRDFSIILSDFFTKGL